MFVKSRFSWAIFTVGDFLIIKCFLLLTGGRERFPIPLHFVDPELVEKSRSIFEAVLRHGEDESVMRAIITNVIIVL